MNIIDELIIPPSENHILLVKYMLTISLILFIPYISMLLGGSFISSYFNNKAIKENNPLYKRFAKDVIEKLSITKSAELALGTIPALSILFAYAQLLFMTNSITVSVLALSIVLFILSFVFIYKYRNSFKLQSIISSFKNIAPPDSLSKDTDNINVIKDFEQNINSVNTQSGNIGKWILLSAFYLFSGTIALAVTPNRWLDTVNILQVIFSWQTLFNFGALASLAGIITGSAIMFYFFSWNDGIKNIDDNYYNLIINTAGKLSIISAVLFPLFVIASYAYLPNESQSPTVFFYMLLLFIIVLFTGGYNYSMYKYSQTNTSVVVFVLVIFMVVFSILKDQEVLSSAVSKNTAQITKIAQEEHQAAKNKTMESVGIDVQAIFNQKCIACHKFDQKVVGPPYNETIPKYNGDVQKLAEFIFNPQKIDPAYPPMPNQGLKKKEATAMAQWLIEQTKK